MAEQATGVAPRDISPDGVVELCDVGNAQLIDVREPYEWEAGRIAGARHIPLGAISGEAATIERKRPIVFICRSGSRSAMATDAFREAGYDAYNLDGGLLAWVDRGLPFEPEDGEVASSRADGG
jgi:rhodanese-related sulfurtransferase